ncbi:MAG: hypothetical protein K6E95_07335 [Lachnospiraceae bacterium]|nr:hypothetical protein [Lachnospiraceae bacterium]
MKVNLETVAGVGLAGLGLIAIGWALSTRSKMKEICEKLDISIDRMSENVEIEVPQKIVSAAIDRAVEREVYNAAKSAASIVRDDIEREVATRVRKEVESKYDDISKSVTDRIAENVAKIDESRLRKEVVEKAKQQIVDKFDGSLDGLLDDFNGNLRNVGKIYTSIAKSFSKEAII